MSLKKEYRNLEMKILSQLRDKINNSKQKSKFVDEKAITVDVFDYVEMVIINDTLTFLDSSGYHYSIFADASLEDLIDILNK